jgi:hypothetical protein
VFKYYRKKEAKEREEMSIQKKKKQDEIKALIKDNDAIKDDL